MVKKNNIKLLIIMWLVIGIMCGCSNGNPGSGDMKQDAWNEARQYVEWFSEKNSSSITCGKYESNKVQESSPNYYTCDMDIYFNGQNTSWKITVFKKQDGDWDVATVNPLS